MADNEKEFKKTNPVAPTPTSTTTPVEQFTEAQKREQQLQREQTQAFLDEQEIARQTMAAQTKAKEQREAKAKK
jgi:hypothetical protein